MPYGKEGRAAFHHGLGVEDSPYADPKRCDAWAQGWRDSRKDYYDAIERLGLNSSNRAA